MEEHRSESIVTYPNRSADRLQSLYEVNDLLKHVVAEGLDINTVLPRVLQIALDELDALTGSIIVVNEHQEPQFAWIIREGELVAHEGPFLEEIVSHGLFAWATRNLRTAVVADTRRDERWIPGLRLGDAEEPGSAICTPLIIRSRPVGAITMTKLGEDQFDNHAVDLLNAIANQAASTIESARLYKESQQRAVELASLVRATAVVSGSLDLDAVLNGLAKQMMRLVNVEAFGLFDWDPINRQVAERLVYTTSGPREQVEPGITLNPDVYPHLEKALDSLAPVQVHRSWLENDSPERRLMVEAGIHTALFLPMVAHDNLITLAVLMATKEERRFGQQEINLLQMLANQGAIAIENARLYEDTQRQLKVSALLNEASKVINSTLDTNQILQSILAQMNELLNAEAISIALVDKQSNELVYTVAEGIGSDKILGLRLPSNQGVSGWVMEHGVPALVQDTTQDVRFYRDADRRTGHDTRAMICAPLQVKGEVLGTIQAINPKQGTFVEDDLQLIVNLANLASSALANAQQFARTQAAEARYMSLFEDSINPILLTDLTGIIIEANRRALEFLGYRRDELLGLPILALHPEGESLDDIPAFSLIGPDKVEEFVSVIVCKDKQTIPVEGYVKCTVSGDSDVLQWIYRDISQQIELEKMRDDLTAMLVHDLQSPLGNIISSLELMRYELPPNADPILDSIVDIAARSSRRLQTLIRSLLDITHLEAGHSITDASFADVNSIISDAQEIVHPALERRRVALTLDIPDSIPRVYVDVDMITRVLINLLDNASKYTPETHEVVITVRELPDNQKLLVSVSDQGSGIPPQYRDVIFDKFRRLQSRTTAKGMGLGLAFCRLAIEAHGGRIWVDDAPSSGARFNFTLPTDRFQAELKPAR